MSESVLPSALAWIGHGHAVFPLWWPVTHNGQTVCACGRLCGKNAAKHPVARYVPHGHCDATLETGIAKLWFGLRVPDANLGVATEKLVVIDVDPRHGGDESLRALEREHEFPLTWRALTGGGGEHIIFAAPDGANVIIGNVVAEQMKDPPLGPGIDVRARGGYIVGVPSKHISGGVYAWSVHPAETPLAIAPDWLIERIIARRPRVGQNDIPIEPLPSDVWTELTRPPIMEYPDAAAARIVGHLFRHNCDYSLVLGLLHAWNTACCTPPLGYYEVKRIVDRIANREADRIERELARGE